MIGVRPLSRRWQQGERAFREPGRLALQISSHLCLSLKRSLPRSRILYGRLLKNNPKAAILAAVMLKMIQQAEMNPTAKSCSQ